VAIAATVPDCSHGSVDDRVSMVGAYLLAWIGKHGLSVALVDFLWWLPGRAPFCRGGGLQPVIRIGGHCSHGAELQP